MLIGACALAGIRNIRFTHIGLDKGLSHTTVNGISQDRLGYIWVATPDGLNRYDGHEFRLYLPDSIDHNIRAVAADSAGMIWAATAHGLYSYSERTERFALYKPDVRASIECLLPLRGGRVAVGTTSGLYILDSATGKFTRDRVAGNAHVTALAEFDGFLTVGTDDGRVFGIDGGRVRQIAKPGHASVNTLMVSRSVLLIGTEGDGLLAFRAGDRAAVRIGSGLASDHVRSLLTDSQGRLWVGTFTGLDILAPDTHEVVFHDDATSPDGGLSHASVRRMFTDARGGIWLGTYFGGLNYYDPLLNQFTTLRKHVDSESSVAGTVAGPIAEDSKGLVWIGTNNGLSIYNPATGEFHKVTHAQGLGSDDVKAIYIDEDAGRAYVGTHIGGMSVVDLAGHSITRHGEVAHSVFDIEPTLDGRLWLATLDGVKLYDPVTGRTTAVRVAGLPPMAANLDRDSHGHLWVSGEGGLAVFAEDGGTLTRLGKMPHLDFHINDVYQARGKEEFWISTHRGLYRYDSQSGRSRRYGKADGLPGDIVNAALEDPNGNIWVSTNRGLACLNPADGSVMTYSNRAGLSNRQFGERSALLAGNGLMYFGGVDGVTYFNPTVLEKNTQAPVPLIEGLRLFGRPVAPGDSTGLLGRGIAETERVTLDADQTAFTINFTTCDFVSEGDNTFRYMLDGLDRQWTVPPADVRSVSYSNLPAGTYTFRLCAANSDGVWSREEARLVIEVLPPWYRTWWAMALFVLLALVAAFAAVRYLWRRKSLEKQRKARQELNEMKVRFFVNMSHELRTPLTLMLLPLNELIGAHPDPATLQKLGTIRSNTLRIRHIVNQLLDYRRAELGMFRLAVSPVNVNDAVESLLEPYRALAKKKNINLRFDSTLQSAVACLDGSYLELIVNNLVTNAFKYTPDGGEITVGLSGNGGMLRLTVSDTGCGIPADKLDSIFTRFYQLDKSAGGYGIGLSLVKRLVELHHGSISVDSTVGRGSTFTVCLPTAESAYTSAERGVAAARPGADAEDVAALIPIGDDAPEPAADADGRKTVLVVDDNAEILKYLSGALSADFRVLTAANGTKAIELLGADSIDLVISDVMMPDMDGVQLCRAVKRNLRTSHIPVILLSAKADDTDRLDGLKVGADDYIAKPFSMDELIAKVRNQIRTRESIIRHYSQEKGDVDPASVAQNPLDEEFLRNAAKVMMDHLDDSQFTTDEFARQMCMSRSNLHLKMKALTGESTNDFIRRTRMRKADELLRSRRYTVAEVSAMVGYSTPSYFATAFKNFFGYPPSTLLNT